MNGDGSRRQGWTLATKSRVDLRRPGQRHAADAAMPACGPSLYPKVEPLLAEAAARACAEKGGRKAGRRGPLCAHRACPATDADAGRGRSLRPRRNICPPRQGHAEHTANGGDASRAIDGNKNGSSAPAARRTLNKTGPNPGGKSIWVPTFRSIRS